MKQTLMQKVRRKFRDDGLAGVLKAIARRMKRMRMKTRPIRDAGLIRQLVLGKIGLEIGGPSGIFSRSGEIPIYPTLARLDCCNFSDQTLWENSLKEGPFFRYDEKKEPGWQFICEASDLHAISTATYDCVLSSHAIEHLANPLRGLEEWLRVLKDGGILVLVVPHRDGTFDRLRPITTLDHLISDYQLGTSEHDLTHMEEILSLYDFGPGPSEAREKPEAFRSRLHKNFHHRMMHHHVFDTETVVAMLDHARIQLLVVDVVIPFHIIAVGQKLSVGQTADNRRFFDRDATFRQRSPFPADKHPHDRESPTHKG
jgi:SAM-dependent methyltransferase